MDIETFVLEKFWKSVNEMCKETWIRKYVAVYRYCAGLWLDIFNKHNTKHSYYYDYKWPKAKYITYTRRIAKWIDKEIAILPYSSIIWWKVYTTNRSKIYDFIKDRVKIDIYNEIIQELDKYLINNK